MSTHVNDLQGRPGRMMSITAMQAYSDASFEELRFSQWQRNREQWQKSGYTRVGLGNRFWEAVEEEFPGVQESSSRSAIARSAEFRSSLALDRVAEQLEEEGVPGELLTRVIKDVLDGVRLEDPYILQGRRIGPSRPCGGGSGSGGRRHERQLSPYQNLTIRKRLRTRRPNLRWP